MRWFKSPRLVQHFLSIRGPTSNLLHMRRHCRTAATYRKIRVTTFEIWTNLTSAALRI
jgi:hypothetical protein